MSPWHWLIVIAIAVLLFGARRLPDAARSLGRSARILKAELGAEPQTGGAPTAGTPPAGTTDTAAAAGPAAPADTADAAGSADAAGADTADADRTSSHPGRADD